MKFCRINKADGPQCSGWYVCCALSWQNKETVWRNSYSAAMNGFLNISLSASHSVFSLSLSFFNSPLSNTQNSRTFAFKTCNFLCKSGVTGPSSRLWPAVVNIHISSSVFYSCQMFAFSALIRATNWFSVNDWRAAEEGKTNVIGEKCSFSTFVLEKL